MFIVITGSTRGLGRALADWCAARGHIIAGCGRNPQRVEELRRRHPPPHEFEAVDVGDPAAVRSWAGRLLARGVPDLLVNNAGLMNSASPLWEVPAAELERLWRTNVAGAANVIGALLPAMLARRKGVVVNFSSALGRSALPGFGPYCASKWAVEGMTRALAEELPAGMAAVTFNPGSVDTDMLRSCAGEAAAEHPPPDSWAERAAPILLALSGRDNGRAVGVGAD